jgi:large subunit ribosomal protein L31
MKADIHPTYFPNATITCACGAVHKTGSTKENITVEICSNCHPFYTGNDKTLDAAGMVDKFKNRAAKAGAKKAK